VGVAWDGMSDEVDGRESTQTNSQTDEDCDWYLDWQDLTMKVVSRIGFLVLFKCMPSPCLNIDGCVEGICGRYA
jgi:hypothetical protein